MYESWQFIDFSTGRVGSPTQRLSGKKSSSSKNVSFMRLAVKSPPSKFQYEYIKDKIVAFFMKLKQEKHNNIFMKAYLHSFNRIF